jgi:hypothetical protein
VVYVLSGQRGTSIQTRRQEQNDEAKARPSEVYRQPEANEKIKHFNTSHTHSERKHFHVQRETTEGELHV